LLAKGGCGLTGATIFYMHVNKKRVYYKRGEWNQFCQRCNAKVKSSAIDKEWTGLLVCKKCKDERHPQDFVEGVLDDMAAPWSTSEPTDKFYVSDNLEGVLLGYTTAAILAGPEEAFDDINLVSVRLTDSTATLASVTEADVLNGANMCAVKNASNEWEILQYTYATPGSSGSFILSHLLRGRVGTELAMFEGFPANAQFVFIGQSSVVTYEWLASNMSKGNIPLPYAPFSPSNVTAFNNGSDIVYGWNRRSKGVRLDEGDIDGDVMLDEREERYEVDVLTSADVALRTLHAVATTQATYSYADQITDFGAAPTAYKIRAYQVSPEWGRGSYREVVFT
jgi:hypothetical protein